MSRVVYEVLDTIDGGFYWRAKGANGETLSVSEVYESKQAARKGIRAAAGGTDPEVSDLTASGQGADG